MVKVKGTQKLPFGSKQWWFYFENEGSKKGWFWWKVKGAHPELNLGSTKTGWFRNMKTVHSETAIKNKKDILA